MPGDVVIGEDGQPIENATSVQLGEDGQPIGTAEAAAPIPEPEVITGKILYSKFPLSPPTEVLIIFICSLMVKNSHQSQKDHRHHLSLNWICRQKAQKYHM